MTMGLILSLSLLLICALLMCAFNALKKLKYFLVLAVGFLAAALVMALSGCGPATKDFSHTQFTSIAFVNQLTLHFDSELTTLDRSECQQAAYYHNDAFTQTVFPIVQSAVGGNGPFVVILPSAKVKDIYIYKQNHLNAPYANGVTGWIDYDNDNRIHIVAGERNILPDLTKLLTKAYYPNTPASYIVTIPGLPAAPSGGWTFWNYVDYINESVMRFLRFIRGI